MNTINSSFRLDKARGQWCIAVAALLLFVGCFSSTPLGLREAVVLLSGMLGAGTLGYAGIGAILSGLVATLYIVVGEVIVRSGDNLFLILFTAFTGSFFVLLAIAKTAEKLKVYISTDDRHGSQLQRLLFASIFILCVLSLTTAIPHEVRTFSLFVCGGLASIFLGYYAQDNMYAALCVATFVTAGYSLIWISAGLWWNPGSPAFTPYVVFSITFCIADLFILIGNRFSPAHCPNTNSSDFVDLWNALGKKCIFIAILATLLIFVSTTAIHVREASILLIGIACAVILGFLRFGRLYVALGVALYLTVTLLLATYFRRYGYIQLYLDKVSTTFCMSYLMATLFAHAGSLYRDQIWALYPLVMDLCKHPQKRWFVVAYVAVLCAPVLALAVLQIDIKFVEIGFLVCSGIVAVVLGYRQKDKLHVTFLLSVALTALLFIPRHFVKRTALKGDIESGLAAIFASVFVVLLGLMFLGSAYKRRKDRLSNHRSV